MVVVEILVVVGEHHVDERAPELLVAELGHDRVLAVRLRGREPQRGGRKGDALLVAHADRRRLAREQGLRGVAHLEGHVVRAGGETEEHGHRGDAHAVVVAHVDGVGIAEDGRGGLVGRVARHAELVGDEEVGPHLGVLLAGVGGDGGLHGGGMPERDLAKLAHADRAGDGPEGREERGAREEDGVVHADDARLAVRAHRDDRAAGEAGVLRGIEEEQLLAEHLLRAGGDPLAHSPRQRPEALPGCGPLPRPGRRRRGRRPPGRAGVRPSAASSAGGGRCPAPRRAARPRRPPSARRAWSAAGGPAGGRRGRR